MFRKSGDVCMVDRLKVGGECPRGCWYFDPLHEYDELKQVCLLFIKGIKFLKQSSCISFFIYIKYDSNCIVLLGQYFLNFCFTSTGAYDVCIINAWMNTGKVSFDRYFERYNMRLPLDNNLIIFEIWKINTMIIY